MLRREGYPNLIVGVTGSVLEDDLTEFLLAGADTIFAKPLKIHSLKKLVQLVRTNGPTSCPTMSLLDRTNELVWVNEKA